jgi:hypothetical protein
LTASNSLETLINFSIKEHRAPPIVPVKAGIATTISAARSMMLLLSLDKLNLNLLSFSLALSRRLSLKYIVARKILVRLLGAKINPLYVDLLLAEEVRVDDLGPMA